MAHEPVCSQPKGSPFPCVRLEKFSHFSPPCHFLPLSLLTRSPPALLVSLQRCESSLSPFPPSALLPGYSTQYRNPLHLLPPALRCRPAARLGDVLLMLSLTVWFTAAVIYYHAVYCEPPLLLPHGSHEDGLLLLPGHFTASNCQYHTLTDHLE